MNRVLVVVATVRSLGNPFLDRWRPFFQLLEALSFDGLRL